MTIGRAGAGPWVASCWPRRLYNPNAYVGAEIKPDIPPPAPRPRSPPPVRPVSPQVDMNATPIRLELKQSPSAKKAFDAMQQRFAEACQTAVFAHIHRAGHA